MTRKPFFLNINGWYGRTGNNVQQIGNALLLQNITSARYITGPSHHLFDDFFRNQKLLNRDSSNIKPISSDFFHWHYSKKDRSMILPYEFIKQRMRDSIHASLKVYIDNCISLISPPKEDLVIHIRVGDIFSKPPGETRDANYIQNPLIFYHRLLSEYSSCRIVTEANWRSHPILQSLLKSYPFITIQSSDAITDFATLIKSKNLASSGVGTFAVAAAMLSNTIKHFYCTDLYLEEHINPMFLKMGRSHAINVKCYPIPNYLRIGEWLNTPSQHKLMLNYGL